MSTRRESLMRIFNLSTRTRNNAVQSTRPAFLTSQRTMNTRPAFLTSQRTMNTRPAIMPTSQRTMNTRPAIMPTSQRTLNTLKYKMNQLRSKMTSNQKNLNAIYAQINNEKQSVNKNYKQSVNNLKLSISKTTSNIKSLQKEGVLMRKESNKARDLAKKQEKRIRQENKASNVTYGFRNKTYRQRAGNFVSGMFGKRR